MVQDQAFGKYYSSPPETVGNIFNDKLEYNSWRLIFGWIALTLCLSQIITIAKIGILDSR